MQVHAVFHSYLHRIFLAFYGEVDGLIPVVTLHEALVCSSQGVGYIAVGVLIEILYFPGTLFVTSLADVHEAVGYAPSTHFGIVLAVVIECLIVIGEHSILVWFSLFILPLLYSCQTLYAQFVDTLAQSCQLLIGVKPLLVPVLCHAVVDSQSRSVIGVVVDISCGDVMVSICKDAYERIFGIFMSAYSAESILVLVWWNHGIVLV